MRETILWCSACDARLPMAETPTAASVVCPACQHPSRVWLFPALFRSAQGAVGQRILEDGQSSCMNHPSKQAVAVCDGCGKFMCALCDVDWNGEHLCTACIQHRKVSDHAGAYQTTYTHYDNIALTICLLSIFLMSFFGLGGFIAPVTIYVAWRYWRVPWRPVPHGKWRMALAVVLGNLIFMAWLGFLVYFVVNIL